ncbi:hypothetical protein pEaSNUABM54_00004 [Erwinia phage pEa_SNUABM_54]|nr:hypothetical protein pEaSNUABM54_00004 [Erwinia phage pEa_SNUABM_54]
MKRLHSLMQLRQPTVSQESDNTDGQVVEQPIEGAPVVQSQTDVLAEQGQAADAAQAANAQVPADGSVLADGTGNVSQEDGSDPLVTAPVGAGAGTVPNKTVDGGDGSQPASPSDQPGDANKRADVGSSVSQEGQPPAPTQPAGQAQPAQKPAGQNVSQESTEGTVAEAPVGKGEPTVPNGQSDTGDGSQPASPSDVPGDSDKRADVGSSNAQPADLAPEMDQKDPKAAQPSFSATAPQKDNVAADANNPQDGMPAEPVKAGEVPAATAASTEALSPEDVAQVAQVAAAAGAAAAQGGAAVNTEIVDGAAAAGDAAVAEGADAATAAAANAADPGGAAAQTAADEVASAANSGDAPGPNAGEAAATPAEAAQVAADLVKDNPDNAAAIAQAIDQVADAAVAASSGGGAVQENAADAAATEQPAQQSDDEFNNNEEQQTDDEFNEAEEKKGEAADGLDDLDDLNDDVEVATESLVGARELLCGLESIVEAALQNGGLSDDAAQILQKVATHVSEQTDQPDEADLGLESLAYSDRLIATEYALGKLRSSIESIDADLQVSTEGLFDIFRSTNSKTRSWVAESRKVVSKLKGSIDKTKKVTVNVPGITDREGYLEGSDRSLLALANILKKHTDNVVNQAGSVAKVAERLRNGNADFDRASDDMDRITITTPDGNGSYDSGELLGGVELSLTIGGTESEAKYSKVGGSASVEITGENAVVALDAAERLLGIMEGALRRFDEIERGADSADGKGSGKALIYLFLFSYLAVLSPDFRRRIGRVFSGDRQNDRVAELKAAFDLSKLAMKASRVAVDEVISVAKKF